MKLERHSKVIGLVEEKEIEAQGEPVEEFRKAGFRIAQATVPRGIREMRLTKVAADNGKQRYAVVQNEDPKIEKYIQILRDSYQGADGTQNLLVVRTVSGMAVAVAASLDVMYLCEVVGCVAGDDTVFCATHSTDDTLLLMEQIREMLLG